MAVSTTDFAPAFSPTTHNDTSSAESAVIQSIIKSLKMIRHPEGGYFAETDRDSRLVSNPFSDGTSLLKGNDSTRSASTTIFYLVTPGNPFGAFHRNKARTVHTLHKGRGRYVVIHADEEEGRDGNNPRIETFVVGHNIEKGETLQWIVEGGKYKASFLLPDDEDSAGSREGLLISEVREVTA